MFVLRVLTAAVVQIARRWPLLGLGSHAALPWDEEEVLGSVDPWLPLLAREVQQLYPDRWVELVHPDRLMFPPAGSTGPSPIDVALRGATPKREVPSSHAVFALAHCLAALKAPVRSALSQADQIEFAWATWVSAAVLSFQLGGRDSKLTPFVLRIAPDFQEDPDGDPMLAHEFLSRISLPAVSAHPMIEFALQVETRQEVVRLLRELVANAARPRPHKLAALKYLLYVLAAEKLGTAHSSKGSAIETAMCQILFDSRLSDSLVAARAFIRRCGIDPHEMKTDGNNYNHVKGRFHRTAVQVGVLRRYGLMRPEIFQTLGPASTLNGAARLLPGMGLSAREIATLCGPQFVQRRIAE